jgi:hypothetical protein
MSIISVKCKEEKEYNTGHTKSAEYKISCYVMSTYINPTTTHPEDSHLPIM